jgi:hypothetical protein
MTSLFLMHQETADERRDGLTLEYYISPIICWVCAATVTVITDSLYTQQLEMKKTIVYTHSSWK